MGEIMANFSMKKKVFGLRPNDLVINSKQKAVYCTFESFEVPKYGTRNDLEFTTVGTWHITMSGQQKDISGQFKLSDWNIATPSNIEFVEGGTYEFFYDGTSKVIVRRI